MKNQVAYVVLAASVFCVVENTVQAQFDLTAPVGEFHNYPLDSGVIANDRNEPLSVWRERVKIAGAGWLRLYFERIDLDAGSTLVISSVLDGAVQHHTAKTVSDWQLTSAYFNGQEVEIELIAGANTTNNRVVLTRAAAQLLPSGWVAGELCGVCNGDDRVASDERWVGRMMPVGCTGSMYSTTGCFVTAGHCLGGANIMQFQVPLSTPGGVPQNPPPSDQYPILQSSIEGENCCPGLDWGFFECGANSETGLFPIEAQGQYRPIAPMLPDQFPVVLEVTGYGVALNGPLSQAQKKSSGELFGIMPFPGFPNPSLFHSVDTTGGNSGSSIMHNGRIVGIATHCQFGCPNIGMPIYHTNFQEAWSQCPTANGDCDADTDADLLDYAEYPDCRTGPNSGPFEEHCTCIEFTLDEHIDMRDFAEFQKLFTGNLCVAPVLTVSPQTQIVCDGSSTVLSAAVAPTPFSLSYQWFKDGFQLNGETGPSLTLLSFGSADEGDYTVLVGTICGETMSPPATLSLCTQLAYFDNFEMNAGWTVTNDPAMTRGQWFRSDPVLTTMGSTIVQPDVDYPNGTGTRCFGTGPFGGVADANDVDGGPTVLFSPIIDLSSFDTLHLRYAYWFFRDNADGNDGLDVSISNNGGASWVEVTRHASSASEWRVYSVDVPSLITPTNNMRLRFSIQDSGAETLLEALIDEVSFVTAD